VRCPQAPQAKQQQKKRTFDVLQNADSFTRYGHRAAGRCLLPRRASIQDRADDYHRPSRCLAIAGLCGFLALIQSRDGLE
jgi:hypothetical protein